ncbi:MAG: hypothetical protein WKI04_02990 [Ferruginibacter sp.]
MPIQPQDYQQAPARSAFITVLCILTFIGSGLGLLTEGVKYLTADSQAAVMSKVKEKANADIERKAKSDDGSEFARMIVNTFGASAQNIRKGALSNMAAAVFCLMGAFLMWNLRKTGFYLYVAGTLVGIVSPFVIFGGSNLMSIGSSVIVGFIGLIFVVLYGINLKYMR